MAARAAAPRTKAITGRWLLLEAVTGMVEEVALAGAVDSVCEMYVLLEVIKCVLLAPPEMGTTTLVVYVVQLAAAEWLETAATMEEVMAGTTRLLLEVVGLTAELDGELATELGEELGVELDEVTAAGAVGLVVGIAAVGYLVLAGATEVDEVKEAGILPPQASSPSLQHQVEPFPSLAQ